MQGTIESSSRAGSRKASFASEVNRSQKDIDEEMSKDALWQKEKKIFNEPLFEKLSGKTWVTLAGQLLV